ncbi:(2Fe-2S)-binding protein, partial [Streptosporangium canum]
MKETVKTKRRSFKHLVPPVDLTGRIERSTRMDRPIHILAKAVRRRLGPGRLRDLLHGVPTGKPLHPPLVTVSLGCWVATAVLDLAHADPRATRAVLTTGIATALPAA